MECVEGNFQSFISKENSESLKGFVFFTLYFQKFFLQLQILIRYIKFLELIFVQLDRILSLNHKNRHVEIHSIFCCFSNCKKRNGLLLAICPLEPNTFPPHTFAHVGFTNLNLRTSYLRVKNIWLLLLLSFSGLFSRVSSKHIYKIYVRLK